MTGLLFVYCTAPSCEEAEKIAETIVGEGLAACANILPGIMSFFRWKGQVERAEEIGLIFKTTEPLFEKLATRIRVLHSYDCPCIVAFPITVGQADYLDWIRQSVTMPEKINQ